MSLAMLRRQRTLLAALTLSLLSSQLSRAQVAANTPTQKSTPLSAQVTDLGPVERGQTLQVTMHLLGDPTAFHQRVDSLYDPNSPNFHHWLTDADLKPYAPTESAVNVIRAELKSNGLAVTSVNDFTLSVSGDVSNLEAAFHTQLHQFSRRSEVFRDTTSSPTLSREVQQYVSSVSGLSSHTIVPLIRRAINPKTGSAYPATAVTQAAAAGGLSKLQTEIALSAPQSFFFDTSGAVDNPPIITAVYDGNVYQANPNIAVGFTAPQLQKLYGLPAAYAAGLDGEGSTIVLLEAYADSHILSDANAFSKMNNIAPLTSANFQVLYPNGEPANQDALALSSGWDTEIGLDVEWAHSIAPAAKIVVVAANGANDDAFQSAMLYIINHRTGYTVSNSWESSSTELGSSLTIAQAYDDILEFAAAEGISFQFSSGDTGPDNAEFTRGAAGVPGDSPHATAVGGTSILNNPNGNGFVTTGWGLTVSWLEADGIIWSPPLADNIGEPPAEGSGGGESLYFDKPLWQSALPGTGRQVPDVSELADPLTGVPIVVTQNGTQKLFLGYGGTSLSSPIFAGLWAIAEQKAGAHLGQAAPLLASLPSGAITDVVSHSSDTDVSGEVTAGLDPADLVYAFYTPAEIFTYQVQPNAEFISAVWNASTPGDDPYYLAVGFGLDGILTVTKGWDNVTGYGTPNGLQFIDAVAAAAGAR